MQEKFRLQVKTHFDAAHRIRDYLGKCARTHGHRWEVEVVLEGSKLDDKNMLVDFAEVKKILRVLLDRTLDHWILNDTLKEPNVTAEYLAKWVFEHMTRRLHAVSTSAPLNHTIADAVNGGMRLVRTCIWESPDCCVKYCQEGGEK